MPLPLTFPARSSIRGDGADDADLCEARAFKKKSPGDVLTAVALAKRKRPPSRLVGSLRCLTWLSVVKRALNRLAPLRMSAPGTHHFLARLMLHQLQPLLPRHAKRLAAAPFFISTSSRDMCQATCALFTHGSHSSVFHPRLTVSTSHVELSGPTTFESTF